MRAPSLVPHLLLAAAVALAGAWLYHLVVPAAGTRLAILVPLIGTTSFALFATYRSCSEPRFAPAVLAAWLALIAGVTVTGTHPVDVLAALTLAVVGARVLWTRPRPVRAIVEVGLGVLAVAGWHWALDHAGSIAAASWCWLLVQSLPLFITTASARDAAPDRFEHAHRRTLEALAAMQRNERSTP
ncbi:MAG: hypothetical protein AAGE01_01755 [Pseudomonadota bacterium]